MPYCHWNARPFVLGVRAKLLVSASSIARCSESGAGGGGRRKWLGEDITIGFQVDSATPGGFVPVQIPGPDGMLPSHFASKLSVLEYSMTRAATARPSS